METFSPHVTIGSLRHHRMPTSQQYAELLQGDLNKLIGWPKENDITCNIENFKVIRYGKNNALQSNHYHTEMEQIEEAESLRDLRVWMNNE